MFLYSELTKIWVTLYYYVSFVQTFQEFICLPIISHKPCSVGVGFLGTKYNFARYVCIYKEDCVDGTHLDWVMYLWESAPSSFCIDKTIFMHDPISSRPMGRFPFVKNQSLFHSHNMISSWRYNFFVCPSCLPITRISCPFGSVSIRIFCFLLAEKVPLLLKFTYTYI